MIYLINRHPALVYHDELANICSPLKALNISYFGHSHIDPQGNFTALNNNPAFMEHYLLKKYYFADIHMTGEEAQREIIIWDDVEVSGESAKMDQEAEAFGVNHTFTIIEKNADGNNFFHFASDTASQSINQVYLANLDLLKLFIKHYKSCVQQSKKLSRANQLVFRLDDNYANFQFHEDGYNQAAREKFLSQLTVSKKKMLKDLTAREVECLSLYVRGHTAKTIAEILSISNRTVETYLANIKEKMFVGNKAQLIEKTMDIFYSPK